jgi:Domain of unknown function (DUF3331)
LFEGETFMQEPAEADYSWLDIIVLFGVDGFISASRHRSVPAEYRADLHRRCAIKVLERHGPGVATVSWSDATAGCYGEQYWRRGVARKNSTCAMSGQTIARGDAVYRPRRGRPAPRNIEAMILASVMETVPLADAV